MQPEKDDSTPPRLKFPSLKPHHSRPILVFVLTYISYCSLYGTRKPFSVVKAHVKDDLGISTYALAAIDTGFLTSYAIGQILLPVIVRRVASLRVVLLIAFTGSCISAITFGLSSTARLMLVLWILNGLFHAVVFPIFITSLAGVFPASIRGRILGVWTTSQQLGSLTSTGFASYATTHLGWRSAFYIPGALMGVIALLLFYFFPNSNEITKSSHVSVDDVVDKEIELVKLDDTSDTLTIKSTTDSDGIMQERIIKPRNEIQTTTGSERPTSVSDRPESGPDVTTSSQIPSMYDALGIPDLGHIATAYFFVKCVRYSLLFWLPFYLKQALSFSTSMAGYSSMLFDLGGIPGAVFLGYVSDKILSGRRLLTAMISCMVAAFAIIVFSNSTLFGKQGVLISLVILGFSIAGPDSILGAAAAQDICERSSYGVNAISVAAGIVNGMGSCGAALQGILTASISEMYGWRSLFTVLGLFLFLAGVLLWQPVRHELEHSMHSHRKHTTTKNNMKA